VSNDETVVRSTCPACGTVDVAASEVTVLGHPADEPRYRYTCPQCYDVILKPTSEQAVSMLRLAGAQIFLIPAEIAERDPAARALDADDLLAFSRALERTDELARLAADGHDRA